MLKAGTETGSIMNHLMSLGSVTEPSVGMGATVLGWTDRHAGTVISVTPKQITVQRDRAVRLDSRGMSESQEYQYESNPNGITEVFRKTKRGWRNPNGNGLLLGKRDEYYDYSF